MKQEISKKKAGSQKRLYGANTEMFDKGNYRLMIIGLVVMTIGFILMAGGKSSDPNVFDAKAIYSTTRITIAPILIVGGLVIEIFAIMKKSKDKSAA